MIWNNRLMCQLVIFVWWTDIYFQWKLSSIIFLFSEYMSAMKIEDLIDPKEDMLPGLFVFFMFLFNTMES